MPLVARTDRLTRKPSSTPSLPGAATPPSASGSGRSLCQTRLDRIVSPTPTYFRSYVRWFLKLKDPQEWPTADLLARAYELGPQLATLEREVRQPLSTMTGEAWEKAEDKLQRLWGQQKALLETLENRRRSSSTTPAAATPARAGTGSAAIGSPSDPADPFSEC